MPLVPPLTGPKQCNYDEASAMQKQAATCDMEVAESAIGGSGINS